MIELYEDQADTMAEVRAAQQRCRRVILRAPCGWGKTYAVAFEIQRLLSQGAPRIYFVVHRKELIIQTLMTFRSLGINPGVTAAGWARQPRKRVQICMVGSMVRRKLPEPSHVILDEAHHAVAKTWLRLFDAWPRAHFLGLSATPKLLSGANLGKVFEEMVCALPEADLIRMGRLADYKAFSHPVSRQGLHKKRGDYSAAESQDRVILGDLVESWTKHAEGLKTVGYAPTVAYSQAATAAFNAAGYSAAHIDANTHPVHRRKRVLQLATGKLDLLWNVDLIGEGFDLSACASYGSPEKIDVQIRCAILARITASLRINIQQPMRAMRAGEGDAVLIDAAGNFRQPHLGLPDDDRDWTLEEDASEGLMATPAKHKFCKKCFGTMSLSATKCPDCGALVQTQEREIKHVDGELVAIERGDRARGQEIAAKRREIEECNSPRQLVLLGMQRGYDFPLLWAEHEWRRRGKSL